MTVWPASSRRSLLAAVLVMAVVTPLAVSPPGLPAQSASAATSKGGRPHPQQVWRPRSLTPPDSIAPIGRAAGAVQKAATAVSESPTAAGWPAASDTVVDLGAPASATATPPGRPAVRDDTTGPTGGVRVSPAGAHPASRVRLTVAAHEKAVAVGVSGVIASVARADGAKDAGSVDLAVDYAPFARAFGGNYADRLRMVALPGCALTTPQVSTCRVQTPVAFVNDREHHRLVATVDAPGTGTVAPASAASAPATVLAATAGTDGVNGSYAATPLKDSDYWSTSGGMGSFDYGYPLATPPALGGSAPSLGVRYDSASVDGRTTVSNAQPSAVGEGWDLSGAGAFIETTYEPCSRVNPTAWGATGDMCVGTPNASMGGGSRAGALVRDDADTSKWRLQSDDGSRVQLLHGTMGGSNNTNDQAYWKVTDTDGTVYLYGANRLPQAYGGTGADAATYSTWSEPVFGTGSGTTCNDPTGSEAATGCRRAWRWNLDFVIDPHGNVIRYSYAREEDFYQHGAAVTEYTRSGFVTEVDYGWQACDIAGSGCPNGRAVSGRPADVVQFDYAPRCLSGASGCPTAPITVTTGIATTGITKANATAFPDVPYDQHCDAGSTSCTSYAPTFYATVRLTGVRTSVNTGGTPKTAQPSGTPAGYVAVDSYRFTQAFPLPQDYSTAGNRPQLRLEQIDHRGYLTNSDGTTAGTDAPAVHLGYTGTLPNRAAVSGVAASSRFYRFRLNEVTDEFGADVLVGYGQPDNLSCGTTAPPATIGNTTLCYPEYFDHQGTMTLDWFNKYVVTGVSVADATRPSGYYYSADRTTSYTYLGTPAWHTNDSEQADPKYRTVDQFRGFRQVQTVSGTEAAGHNAKTLTTYFRGMDQDPGVAVNVGDAHGGSYRDDNALAGDVLEVQTFADETSNTPVHDVISVPVDPTAIVTAAHTRSAPLPAQRAHFSETARVVGYDQVSTSTTPRRSETDYTYDSSLPAFTGAGGAGGNGRRILTDDKGDGTVPELCTFIGYADNVSTVDTAQWTAYPYTTIVSTVPAGQTCTTSSETATTTVSQTQTLYDGQPQGSLTRGDVTGQQAAPAFNANWVTLSTAGGYDGYGRAGWTADANSNTTSVDRGPLNGLIPIQFTTTNPKGWRSTTTVDRGRGVTLWASDVNGRRTDSVYDGLGRVLKSWAPDHSMANNPNLPNATFSYGLYGTTLGARGTLKNPYTATQRLRENGTYAASYAVFDGLGEQVESQSTPLDGSAGTVSSQVEYDSLGRAFRTANPHYDRSTNPSGAFVDYGNALPSQGYETFDGLSRPLTSARYSLAQPVPGMTTTYAYPGTDRVDVTPPTGGTATSTVTDVRGRTTELWTYRTATATGNRADADVTGYGLTYTATGRTSTVTDATGRNTWSTSTGDLLGRTVTRTDPDAGTATTVLDNAGRVLQLTDARGQVISYSYDQLDRKTGTYKAAWSATPDPATQLAGWVYDTAPGSDGKPTNGLPTSATRYLGSAKYTSEVTGYDAGSRPLGSTVTIPDTEGALAGTYTSKNHYTPVTGLLDRTDLPAAGGLPAETVYNSYNVNGLPLGTGGNADYVVDTVYDPYGRVQSRTLGDYPHQVVTQNLYDPATGRVTNTFVDATAGQSTVNPSQLNTYSVDYTSYAYNAAGLLTSTATLQNYTVSGSYNPGASVRDVQCFTYDYAGRLTNAWSDTGDQNPSATTNLNSPTTQPGGLGSCANTTPAGHVGGPAPYWQSYGFTGTDAAAGNRTRLVDHDPTGSPGKDVTRTSSYPAAGSTNKGDSGGPHLLGSVASTGGTTGTDSYSYDAAGNTVSRRVTSGAAPTANQTLTWDAEGHLSSVADSVTGQTASFVYDANGSTLIRRDHPTGTTNGTVTLYLGNTELHLTGRTVTGTRYYTYPSAPTIVATGTGALSYELTNAQGTGGTTINAANGQITARRYLKPFGDVRGTAPGSWVDDHTFLGDPTDPATGLTTVGARTYDAGTGRFISADPVLQVGSPQLIGGYAYAGNDPVNLTDPSGLDPNDPQIPPVPTSTADGPHTSSPAQPSAPATPAPPSPAEDPAKYGPCTDDCGGPFTLIYQLSGMADAVHCVRDGDIAACGWTALNVIPGGKVVSGVAKIARAVKVIKYTKDADDLAKLGKGFEDAPDPGADIDKPGLNHGPVDVPKDFDTTDLKRLADAIEQMKKKGEELAAGKLGEKFEKFKDITGKVGKTISEVGKNVNNPLLNTVKTVVGDAESLLGTIALLVQAWRMAKSVKKAARGAGGRPLPPADY